MGYPVNAQYKVGDTYEKDGVKAVVIKVNSDGSHGLILKLDTKAEMLENYQEVAQAKKEEKQNGVKDELKELRKQHMYAICNETTLEGKHNFKVIEKYCSENNVDMEQVFPDFARVKKLGEGWFIPGDAELAYIHNYISRGYGTKMKLNEFKEKVEKIRKNKGFEECIFPGFYSIKVPCQGYKSSTWTADNENKKEKFNGVMPHCSVQYYKSFGGMKYWYQLQTGNYESNVTALGIKATKSLYDIWSGKRLTCPAVSEF